MMEKESAGPLVAARPAIANLRPKRAAFADFTVAELRRILNREDVHKLSYNENPYGPSPRAVAAIQKAAATVHLYHDIEDKGLKTAIAAAHGVDPSMVYVAAGGYDALVLPALAYAEAGSEVVFMSPSFGTYLFASHLAGAAPVPVALREDFAADLAGLLAAITPRTRLLYLCNPNNPTGIAVLGDELAGFLEAVPPSVLVVLDEAYAEFVTDRRFLSGVQLARQYPNLVTVRTFSKLYGLAGLRLGYGIAHPDVVAALDRVRNPFNTNVLVQAAAIAALEDHDFTADVVRLNAAERRRLTEAFAGFGFKVLPSQTNFVFADTGRDADALCRRLAEHGVIIRSGSSWNMPSYIRVTVGSAPQNSILLAALAKLL